MKEFAVRDGDESTVYRDFPPTSRSSLLDQASRGSDAPFGSTLLCAAERSTSATGKYGALRESIRYASSVWTVSACFSTWTRTSVFRSASFLKRMQLLPTITLPSRLPACSGKYPLASPAQT